MATHGQRHLLRLSAAVLAAGIGIHSGWTQETRSATFDDPASLKGWQTEGPVSLDTTQRRGNDGQALKIEPGGSARWTLRSRDGSGKVEFWVYDDGSAPANPKARLTGPYYGVAQQDGRVLAPGSLYAPYLSGDSTYAVTAFNPEAKEQPYFAVQYLGIKRTPGWHKWTVVFDPEDGVSMLHNDTDVNERRERFTWHSTKIGGFSAIVLMGDSTPDGKQTIWVDDVSVALGGPMGLEPADTAPPPPPPATPESDPVPDKPAALVEGRRNVHPRLLFTAQDIPAMRKKIQAGYGKHLFDRMVNYLPSCVRPDHTRFLTDATDGQRQGFWRLPTVALHWVLTGNETSFERTVEFMEFLMGLENWETGSERDAGMSSANIMIGAALAYDWLYHDLDPEFRQQYRDKLLLMARRQYHQGHLKKLAGTHYWQNDPGNNHRFHRDAGMTLAVLAAAEDDKTDDDWLLTRTLEEIRFIVKWLPRDGSCHESPTYSVFGNTHLTLAVDAAQQCFGEPFMDHPFFRQAPAFKIHTMRPDLKGVFHYGDSGGGTTGYHSYLQRMCAYHDLADEQDAIREIEERNENFYNFTWFSVIWWKPLPGGDLAGLPLHALFPDVGVATFRTGWQPADVGAMFTCGPFGGYELNAFRKQHDMRYINVAHDDPDANSFILYADGVMLAETDRYSKHKKSANHNTILINGSGQVVAGRPEGMGWSQPGGDMSRMAVITAEARQGRHRAIEGEASGSYPANPRGGPKRPALERYRRTFIWIEGRYVLVLDDIRAPDPVDITWLMQGPELTAEEGGAGRYLLAKDDAVCPFQVTATADLTEEIVESPADHRGKPIGHRQLRLSANTDTLRLASVYDAWKQGTISVRLDADTPDHAMVTVAGKGFRHQWDWNAPPGGLAPSRVTGTNEDGDTILVLNSPEPRTRELLEQIDTAVNTP